MKRTDLIRAIENRTSRLQIIAASCVAAIYLFHLYCLYVFAVDVPFYDEWEGMGPEQIPDRLSLSYLRMQHNEHRIFWTRLQMWGFFKLADWNLIAQQLFNYLLFGCILLAVYFLWQRLRKNQPSLLGYVVLVFLLTPRNHENHFWGFQSQFHCVLLFFLLSVFFLFEREQKVASIGMGMFSLVATLYSFSAGVPLSLVTAISFVCFKAYRFFKKVRPRDSGELIEAALVSAVYSLALFSWFYDYHRFTGHPAFVLPMKIEFWLFLANFVAHGFGVDRVDTIGTGAGIFLLGFFFLPLLLVLFLRKFLGEAEGWAVVTWALAVLAAASIVAMGRAGFNYSFMAKSSRYAEIANMFMPVSLLLWLVLFQGRRAISGLIVFIWLGLCFVGHLDNWNFYKVYAEENEKRVAALGCAVDYYRGKNDGNCPALYPFPMADRLALAREKKLSFYRRYVLGEL